MKDQGTSLAKVLAWSDQKLIQAYHKLMLLGAHDDVISNEVQSRFCREAYAHFDEVNNRPTE